MTLPALTIHQPYADQIVTGRKRYETRSWTTKYRGLIVIHAAKRPARPGLPTRAIVAIARLVDVSPTDELTISSTERAAGDFGPGRYAWRLVDVRPLSTPIPYRGKQGLWRVDAETSARLIRAARPFSRQF